MRFKRRMKRSTKQYIIVALICIIVIGTAAIFTSIIITDQIKREYQYLLEEEKREKEANQREVYVAISDIYSGEVVTEDKVECKIVYSSQPQDTYIDEMEIGMTALVDIREGTQILHSMLTDNGITSKLRETEYRVILMNSNIIKNDTVDIRIRYPNGESYIVLSKKEIIEYNPETASVFLWLEEEELLRMSAAIVDAGVYSGAELYVTKYIQPTIQEASVVNYTPGLSILTLLESNPNIVEKASLELSKKVRKALENRLAESLGEDVTQIHWDIETESLSEAVASPTPEPGKEALIKDEDSRTSEDDARIGDIVENEGELGASDASTDYFYYAKEPAFSEDIEYGE